MNRRHVLVAGVAAMPMSSAWAQTVDVAGVKFDAAIQLGGGPLKLNGHGVRRRFMFEVYAAGLYLSTPANTLEGVLAAPGAKRIQMVLLRKLDASDFGKVLTSGIEKNASREEFAQNLPAIQRLGEATAAYKQLVPGDTTTIDWLPDTGMTMSVKGKPLMEPVKEPSLFAAMMKIWLGSSPVDGSLKEGLLGLNRPA